MSTLARNFSKPHILRTTLYHTRRSVDISIDKCLGNIKVHPHKAEEILSTLDVLNELKQLVIDFEKQLNSTNEEKSDEAVRRAEIKESN